MPLRNSKSLVTRAAICSALLLIVAPAAQAQPSPIALVVGNSNYSAFPALPACIDSSQSVANALRSLGFQVILRQDVTGGAFAAAISEFSRGMEAKPDASAFVYICGYAAGMNDRPFLLPVSANIARPSDVMTQGILAKAILDVLNRGKPSRGVAALDLVPMPDGPSLALNTLSAVPVSAGTGLIAVLQSQPTTVPTPLSSSLAAGLAVPGVQAGALLGDVEAELAKHPSVGIAALRMPSVLLPLAADEQPPPSLPVPPQPEQIAAPVTAPVLAPAASAVTAPIPALPDEGAMTAGERGRVQEALARLGYYAGAIDGIFGRETRAAIRRFQHEIGVEMTGVITGAQATRLVTEQ